MAKTGEVVKDLGELGVTDIEGVVVVVAFFLCFYSC
jgi:hypothetical protein